MNGFYILLIVLSPFLTAIIITLGVLWHKRRVMELRSDTDIDVIELNKKIDKLIVKIEKLENSIEKSNSSASAGVIEVSNKTSED